MATYAFAVECIEHFLLTIHTCILALLITPESLLVLVQLEHTVHVQVGGHFMVYVSLCKAVCGMSKQLKTPAWYIRVLVLIFLGKQYCNVLVCIVRLQIYPEAGPFHGQQIGIILHVVLKAKQHCNYNTSCI